MTRGSRTATLAIAASFAACGKSPPPPTTFAVCAIEDRVLDAYVACRAANPHGVFRAEDLETFKRDKHALRDKYIADDPRTVERICASSIDKIRVDAAGEDCTIALTAAERAAITTVFARRTPAVPASTPTGSHVLAEHARYRDRVCACTDKACVEAADRDVKDLPYESLKGEPAAVLAAFDEIGDEAFDCTTRPLILSPDRWQRVK